MQRLSLDTWGDIFRNLSEMAPEDYHDGIINWVEILWLESSDEWILCHGEELFEDGFETEQEAQERLYYLENILL